MRCVHEASLHAEKCFITLTYRDEHLPARYLHSFDARTGRPRYAGTLVKKHFQDFAKRLRRRFGGRKISYFHCGEYGELARRPHYHSCLFGVDFPDRRLHRERGNVKLYTSAVLSELWPFGFVTVGELTFESAAYTARYVMKKVTGDQAARHYVATDLETGELITLQPEYVTMSLKPAVGKGWFERYHEETYRDDSVIMRGRELKPPRYYDKLFDVENPEGMYGVRDARRAAARAHKADSTPERLAVREKVKRAQVSQLKRGLEDGTAGDVDL